MSDSCGCVLGVAHIQGLDLQTYDPDAARIVALVEAIEDAIATAQLARTGDKRAIKQLAVIYRVLRGDDLQSACNGVGLSQDGAHAGIGYRAVSLQEKERQQQLDKKP